LNGFESTGNARNGILLLSSGSGKDMPDFRSYVKSVTTCSSKHIHIKFKKSKSRYLKDNGGGQVTTFSLHRILNVRNLGTHTFHPIFLTLMGSV
jgi:hypothetical protein